MTKKEMINEMISGLNFQNNQRVINRCLKQPKEYVEKAYNLYLNEGEKVKRFCITCLNR